MKTKLCMIFMIISFCFVSSASEFTLAVDNAIKKNESSWGQAVKKKLAEEERRAKEKKAEEERIAKKKAEEERRVKEKKAEEERKTIEERIKSEKLAEEKNQFIDNAKNYSINKKKIMQETNSMMYPIPGKNYLMLSTEVTQKLYKEVMGENPSKFKGENNPVECVSWNDAIYFCNKLSERCGLSPVYVVGDKTDVTKWKYTPHQKKVFNRKIKINEEANGFRLPTVEEWLYAARSGENYDYSGSDNIYEVGWCESNSKDKTHEVAGKKPNGYGLYDMSGNVKEWCWDPRKGDGLYRNYYGGSWDVHEYDCQVKYSFFRYDCYAGIQYNNIGFRIVCKAE